MLGSVLNFVAPIFCTDCVKLCHENFNKNISSIKYNCQLGLNSKSFYCQELNVNISYDTI